MEIMHLNASSTEETLDLKVWSNQKQFGLYFNSFKTLLYGFTVRIFVKSSRLNDVLQ